MKNIFSYWAHYTCYISSMPGSFRKLDIHKGMLFWLNVTCLPFLPWDERSEDKINLTEVLRLYLGIYQYNTNGSLNPDDVPAFLELLADRYRMVKDIVLIKDQSQMKIELGRFALPEEHDIVKLTKAALARRLEIHYTPKHGSWLNVAEIELSVLSRQCLDRTLESMQRLERECGCWNVRTNGLQKGVDWQFTEDDAHIQLRRLYPQVQS